MIYANKQGDPDRVQSCASIMPRGGVKPIMRITTCFLATVLSVVAPLRAAQQPAAPAPDSSHQDGVTSRGDHAMGFSHETATHHFRLSNTGGVIDVAANDRKDAATRDQIRMHLGHIAKRFSAGDFDVPMFIHDTMPPGAAVMAKLREQIRYVYRDTPGGAQIQISTANHEALEAVHAFLRFQISDHQTGDATEVR